MNSIIIIFLCLVVLIALYFLMIMPRMTGKPDISPYCKWLYAHRGLHNNKSDAPENSIEAFRKAVEAGYGIELDIQLSKDKIPVVFHDFSLKRMCAKEGKVSDYTYKELQEFTLCNSTQHIPKLEEVLKLVDGKVPLIVEFKIPHIDISICPIADKLLQSYQGMYCMESFNPLGVLWYRRNRTNVVRGQLSDDFLKEGKFRGLLYFLLKNLVFNFMTKPDFIAYNHKYPHVLSRKLCHRIYHSTAVAWTIQSEQQLKAAKQHFDIFIFDSFTPAKYKIAEK